MREVKAELKTGNLDIVVIESERLVLGKYDGEKTYTPELIKALKRAGVSHGYLENCLSMMESGEAAQLPIAKAYVDDEPGVVKYLYGEAFTVGDLIDFVKTGKIVFPDVLEQIPEHEKLVEILSTPVSVLRYPNGEKKILKEFTAQDIQYYAGLNASVCQDGKSICSEIGGTMSKNVYGPVSIYPIVKVRNIGKAHGKVYYEAAVHVESDIRSESDVETTSNISVNGMIRASKINAGGSVRANFGFDNPKKLDVGIVVAGQSVYSTAIRNYKIWAGQSVIASTIIENSQIHSLHQVASPRIKSSEIKVANKLITQNIEGNCRIYLGPYFVKDQNLQQHLNFQNQHTLRLADIENKLKSLRDRLIIDKSNTLAQINKLKRANSQLIPKDVLLNRFYQNQIAGIQDMRKAILEYEDQLKVISKDKMKISIYEQQFKENRPVTLLVSGNLGVGTVIYAPNETLKIEKELSGVKITLDEYSGKLNLEQLD